MIHTRLGFINLKSFSSVLCLSNSQKQGKEFLKINSNCFIFLAQQFWRRFIKQILASSLLVLKGFWLLCRSFHLHFSSIFHNNPFCVWFVELSVNLFAQTIQLSLVDAFHIYFNELSNVFIVRCSWTENFWLITLCINNFFVGAS